MSINDRRDPNGMLEDNFRLTVRNILDVDLFTRDDEIFDRLKALKRRAENYDAGVAEVHQNINAALKDLREVRLPRHNVVEAVRLWQLLRRPARFEDR